MTEEHDPNVDYLQIPAPNPEDMDFESALKIDINNLDAEFIRQPELTAQFGQVEVTAQFAYEKAKTQYDVLFAQVMEEKRANYELSGRRIAKATLEGLVECDVRIGDASRNLLAFRKKKRLATVAYQAIRDRLSVLISVAANQRAQMQNLEPYIKSGSHYPSHPVSQPIRVDEAMVPGRGTIQITGKKKPTFGKNS